MKLITVITVNEYIPIKKAFSEGGYETINSRIQPGGGEKMVETAIRLLNEMAKLSNVHTLQ